MKFRFTAVLFAALSISTVAIPVSADKSLNDGVYTKAQAEKGKTSYENNCKACHQVDFYQEKFQSWQGAPLIEFYDLVTSTMPGDRPGALELQDYTDAMAHIFSLMGYPAGDKALSHEDGSMDSISIVVN